MAGSQKKQTGLDSKQVILNAAIAEFAEHGRDGVRMEKVAQRAGLNKALVYRHFESREKLFEMALESVFADRFKLLDDLPDELVPLFEIWTKRFAENPLFLKLMLRESLELASDEPIHADLRERYYRHQVDGIRQYQQEGKLPADMDPESLFLMLTAILVFPYLLPQVTRLVTGKSPESKSFKTRWKKQFDQLIAYLEKK